MSDGEAQDGERGSDDGSDQGFKEDCFASSTCRNAGSVLSPFQLCGAYVQEFKKARRAVSWWRAVSWRRASSPLAWIDVSGPLRLSASPPRLRDCLCMPAPSRGPITGMHDPPAGRVTRFTADFGCKQLRASSGGHPCERETDRGVKE